jgi:hypothetical protein
MANKLGRDGRKPKQLGPIPAHNGQYYKRNGALVAGVSRTQAEHPLDDERMVHQSSVAGKNLPPAVPVVGHRNRRNDPLC